jgi:tetratricopeptide (TPR) repeat protein
VNLANEGDKSRQSNLDDAISKYEQATQLDPSNHRILWKLALAYHKKEAWADDALTCAKAQKVAPTFANYFFEQGYAIKQQAVKGPTSWSEAKSPLEQAIKLDPGLSDPYEDLGDVLYHLDDEQGALQNYTKAIEVKPDQLGYYVSLAQLYFDLGRFEQAAQVAREGLTFQNEGMNTTPDGQQKAHNALFSLHTFLGGIAEAKGDVSTEITEYEAAKKACGQCTDPGQQIAFLDLGAAYSHATPPRKNEGIQQLQAFSKIVCRGAAAARYADQCQYAQDVAKKLGGTLQ